MYVTDLRSARRVDEVRLTVPQTRQLLVQGSQRCLAEPGADAPSIHKAGSGIGGKEQGAEVAAGTLRIGTSDDHELLSPQTLDLEPPVAAS